MCLHSVTKHFFFVSHLFLFMPCTRQSHDYPSRTSLGNGSMNGKKIMSPFYSKSIKWNHLPSIIRHALHTHKKPHTRPHIHITHTQTHVSNNILILEPSYNRKCQHILCICYCIWQKHSALCVYIRSYPWLFQKYRLHTTTTTQQPIGTTHSNTHGKSSWIPKIAKQKLHLTPRTHWTKKKTKIAQFCRA